MDFKQQEGKKSDKMLSSYKMSVLENYTERERDNSYSYP